MKSELWDLFIQYGDVESFLEYKGYDTKNVQRHYKKQEIIK